MSNKLNTAIAACLMLCMGAACSDDKVKDPDNTEPGFKTDVTAVEVDAAGGEYAVGYTLSGEDEQVTLTTDADWIESLKTTDAKQIAFTVAANLDADDRAADIKVRYDGEEFVIGVSQKSLVNASTTCNLARCTYGGGDNAALLMSDKGIDEFGATVADASYYYVSLPVTALKGDMLEEGVYTEEQIHLEMVKVGDKRMPVTDVFSQGAVKAVKCMLKVTKSGEKTVEILLTGNFEGYDCKLHYNGEVRYNDETADDEWQQHDVCMAPVIATCFYQQKIGLNRDLWTLQLCDVMPDVQGNISGNAHLMYINVIAEATPDHHIKTGDYPVSLYAEASTIAPGSFGIMPAGTFLVNLTENGNMAIGLAVKGHVKIEYKGGSDYAVDMNLTTDRGFYVQGSFDGKVPVNGYPTKGESTLAADYEVKLPTESTVGVAKCYGDYFQNGGVNWVVTITPENGEDDGIQFDLNCAGSDASKPADGKYLVGEGATGTFHYGYFNDGQIGGTLFFGSRNSSGGIDRYAPALDGEVSLKNNSDGTCTITFCLYDDWAAPHKFYGSWKGRLEINDKSGIQKKENVNHGIKCNRFGKQVRNQFKFYTK